MSSRRRRNGFTLVELLVVITIIGMLMAMMFPALGSIIDAVRNAGCQANLNSIYKGVNLYEAGVNKGFPGLVENGRKSKAFPNGVPMPWTVSILSQLGEVPIHKTWYEPQDGSEQMLVAPIRTYVCGSDYAENTEQQLSYVINAGSIGEGLEPAVAGVQGGRVDKNLDIRLQSNGIAFNRYTTVPGFSPPRIKRSSFKKGAQFMALLSENIQAWNWGDKRRPGDKPMPYDDRIARKSSGAKEAQMFTGFVWDGLQINEGTKEQPDVRQLYEAPDSIWARPSSFHPDGVNMMFCDGSIRFVRNRIQRAVYQSLCMTNPQRASSTQRNGLEPDVRAKEPTEDDFP
jgi:prepilin-type N-terminal cleavage/methylation domain-containing protein/prepilin-type processing-associated H-X9-DG protein